MLTPGPKRAYVNQRQSKRRDSGALKGPILAPTFIFVKWMPLLGGIRSLLVEGLHARQFCGNGELNPNHTHPLKRR